MPGKMLGVLRPSIYRFKLGAFEMTTILDGAVQRDGPYPLFGANASAEEVEALAVANRLPPRLLEHPFIPCVLNTGKELILFDTGNQSALLPNCRDLNLNFSALTDLVISHGHYDHTGGVDKVLEEAGPIEVYLHQAAMQPRYANGEEEARPVRMPAASMRSLWRRRSSSPRRRPRCSAITRTSPPPPPRRDR